MKKLILVLFLFIGAISFAQIPSLYQQGYNTGRALARECDNANRFAIYQATISAGHDEEYTHGVIEGWMANSNYCSQTIDPIMCTVWNWSTMSFETRPCASNGEGDN